MISFRLPGVDAVGFDLDGTLMDHPGAAVEGVRALVESLGVPHRAEHDRAWFDVEAVHFRRWLDGEVGFVGQRRDRIRDVFRALDLPEVDDPGAEAAFEVFRAAYSRSWRAYADVVETLERLRGAGVKIGVLTNGPGWQQREKLDRIGVLDLVDVVCATDEIGAAKPAAAAFDAFVAALGVPAERVVFVGDDPEADVFGARAAGIRAALVRSRERGVAELPSAVRRAAAMPVPAPASA